MTRVFPEVSHIVHFPHSAKEIYEQESCYYLQIAKCVCHRDVAKHGNAVARGRY